MCDVRSTGALECALSGLHTGCKKGAICAVDMCWSASAAQTCLLLRQPGSPSYIRRSHPAFHAPLFVPQLGSRSIIQPLEGRCAANNSVVGKGWDPSACIALPLCVTYYVPVHQ
eukprot:GHUV01035091.1.p3 GENE.GHUV01035091.1~~GHUV01035091.1.p3  ORF type:complete len:114 (-),score=10.36 GHUV01035091.1:530-871(-)